jgi:hypothetical protein
VLFRASVPVAVGAPIEYVITLPQVPASKAVVQLRCVGTVVREQLDEEVAFAATLERYQFVRTPA